MIPDKRRWGLWLLYAAGLGVVVTLTVAGFDEAPYVAFAHAPILLTRRHMTQLTAPTLLDGRVSFALYGMLEEAGDARHVRVVLPERDDLSIEALVPDLPPENDLDQQLLPTIDVTSPSGETTTLTPNQSTPFFEEFTHTSFITYLSDRRAATAGIHFLRISAPVPCRFVIAVGYDEDRLWEAPAQLFGAGIASNEELATWYRVPPPPQQVGASAQWSTDVPAQSST